MKIAFGVFDWGLGHATRDIPLISALLKRKDEVHIISTGRAMTLLKDYFGNKCRYFDVPSIHVPYRKNRFFATNFWVNIPRMIYTLKKARKITEQIIKNEKYNRVISDCRYDVYDKIENSFLINHQVRFKALPIIQRILEGWLASRSRKYKYVIVPDFKTNNLSGELSHNLKCLLPSKIKYIGILSQLQKKKVTEDIDYFISISGPEPQRTVLEEKIIPALHQLSGKIVVTLGRPESKDIKFNKKIRFFSFLDSKKQGEMMNRAKFIITRSGYTTIMEIAELNKKKVLFIPTPGQTEQEYLGNYYENKKYFHHVSQYKLNLGKDVEIARKFKGFKCPWKTEESVKKFLEVIK
jgi:uncharacterized protein (TIGR00661 family)